jgi:hypothetical protein
VKWLRAWGEKDDMSFQKRRKQAAYKMLAQAGVIYGPDPHEYRDAIIDEFPQLDRDFYDGMRGWFECRGFRYLGDCENLTLSRVFPTMRTLIRRMVGADGTICVALHDLRTIRKEIVRHRKTIDLETELSDGTFVVTNNSGLSGMFSAVPSIADLLLPLDTEPELLLRTHTDRIAEILNVRPGIAETRVGMMEEAFRFQHRLHALKATLRRAFGYPTREDFEKMKGRPLTIDEEGLVEEIEKLKAAE